jgi:DNA-binding response OmpR family regulator
MVSMFSGRWVGTNQLTFGNPRIVLSVAPATSDAGDRSGGLVGRALRSAGASVEVVDPVGVDAGGVIDLEPDLVVVDIRSLDEARGSDHAAAPSATGLIRAVHEAATAESYVPIVALLDDRSVSALEHLFEVGADDVLLKPFDLAELFLRLDNLLQSRHLHLELQLRNAELRSELDRLRATNEQLRSLIRELEPSLLRERGLEGD